MQKLRHRDGKNRARPQTTSASLENPAPKFSFSHFGGGGSYITMFWWLAWTSS